MKKAIAFSFVNVAKMFQFKVKDSEIKPYPSCLVNILKDFTLGNMKKNNTIGNPIDTSHTIDIHKFLIKER